LVAVGYVDPGNWATDIAAGAHYGTALLGVVVLASLMGILFQNLSARLAMATGEDLAQAVMMHLGRGPQWVARWGGEVAILATAVAELMGGALALALLWHWSLLVGVLTTAAGTLLVLALSQRGQVVLERVVATLMAVVAGCFAELLWRAQPHVGTVLSGAVTLPSGAPWPVMLLALGIVGATVMPHNLYLHAGLVAERLAGVRPGDRALAWRVIRNDTRLALTIALLVNAAMLVVAATALTGLGQGLASLTQAHAVLGTTLGSSMAVLFAVGLYAAGQSSAMTGVLAGQMLTRGFGRATTGLWRRAILTRLLGGSALMGVLTAWPGVGADRVLVGTQSVLGLCLPMALVPLAVLVTRPQVMGPMVVRGPWAVVTWTATAAVAALDLALAGWA